MDIQETITIKKGKKAIELTEEEAYSLFMRLKNKFESDREITYSYPVTPVHPWYPNYPFGFKDVWTGDNTNPLEEDSYNSMLKVGD